MTQQHPDVHHDASSNVIFAFWLYLMTDFILFATCFATYAVLSQNTFGGPEAKELFSLPYALAQTLLLLVSSLTCGLASLAMVQNDQKRLYAWYSVTFFLGVSFLAMLWIDCAHLVASGNSWSRSGFLSSYFTLIGLHGVHILIGLLFMVFFLVQVWFRGLIPVTIRRLTCLKMFWFFSYIVWIFMFTIVYLIGAS
jgi:cytochrome o ubiquinol oxidase subunit 3